LCPSEKEGFGLCVLEALAATTAVVVSDRDPFTEWLPADVACFVDPHSESSIAQGLLRLAFEPKERERRALAGRRLAQQFSWDTVADAHLAEYERFVTRGASNPRRAEA
jgi:glycosyltransferase involved in cell wall biosynthesis